MKKRRVRPNLFGRSRSADPKEEMRKTRTWRNKFNYFRVSEGMSPREARAAADVSYMRYQRRKKKTAGKDVAFRRNSRRYENDPDYVNDEILAGVVEGLWLLPWANAVEEAGLPLPRHITIEDVPEPPDTLNNFAFNFGVSVMEKNRGKTLDSLYEEALLAPGKHLRPPTAREFGYYLAMEALGSGVSWDDNHPKPRGGYAKVPDVEILVGLEDPDDEDSAYLEYAEVGR